MKNVLVDTSVWIAHFRQTNAVLLPLLEADLVRTHPLIVGEIACGSPPCRKETLFYLAHLKSVPQAALQEVMDFIEREALFGLGCGLIDLFLLASTLMSQNTALWTMDKRLAALAKRFGVMYAGGAHSCAPAR